MTQDALLPLPTGFTYYRSHGRPVFHRFTSSIGIFIQSKVDETIVNLAHIDLQAPLR